MEDSFRPRRLAHIDPHRFKENFERLACVGTENGQKGQCNSSGQRENITRCKSSPVLVKRYRCTTCNKTYSRKGHLTRHQWTHKAEKQICGLCQREGKDEKRYTFSDPDTLRRHIEHHTGACHPLVAGDTVTLNHRVHSANRALYNAKAGTAEEEEAICLLAASHPPRNRRYGGLMTKGPLAGQNVTGNKAFNCRGTLMPNYHHRLKSRISVLKGRTASVSEPAARPRRRCKPLALPQPFFRRSSVGLPIGSGTFTVLRSNLYHPARFEGRKRPKDLPKDWQWPQNPTYIPSGEKQCDLCTERICGCITQIRKARQPEVMDYGPKGQGLMAVALKKSKEDDVFNEGGKKKVYKAGDILGELTGELVPDESQYNDGWSLQLKREDLDREPVLGYIHCLNSGNWVRKANHSCDNVCELEGMRISGRYRIMLVAVKDIFDGEEVTVSYGDEYWQNQRCLCGSKNCVSRKLDSGDSVDERLGRSPYG